MSGFRWFWVIITVCNLFFGFANYGYGGKSVLANLFIAGYGVGILLNPYNRKW